MARGCKKVFRDGSHAACIGCCHALGPYTPTCRAAAVQQRTLFLAADSSEPARQEGPLQVVFFMHMQPTAFKQAVFLLIGYPRRPAAEPEPRCQQ